MAWGVFITGTRSWKEAMSMFMAVGPFSSESLQRM
jgi:hypothetical protein